MKCPRCRSAKDLYKSKSGNRELSAIRRALVVAVRCHRCGVLFHRPTLMVFDLDYKSDSRCRAA
jgi:hypothetical protein